MKNLALKALLLINRDRQNDIRKDFQVNPKPYIVDNRIVPITQYLKRDAK